MDFEELSSRPISGRQPRSRNRIAVDGISATRADYVSRPAVRPRSAARQITVASFSEPTAPVPEVAPIRPAEPVAITPVEQTPIAPAPAVTESTATAIEPAPTPDTLSQPEPVQQEAASPAPKILDFTPPEHNQKQRRFAKLRSKVRKPRMSVSKRLATAMALIILVGGLGSGAASYVAANQDGDDALLRKSLLQALEVRQLHVATNGQTAINFDFNDQKNPIVSGTFAAEVAGLPAVVNGYGDTKNNYVAYASLPSVTPAPAARQVTGSWVQLRANGMASPGVPASLAHAAEPRYRIFGPVLFGNLPEQARIQLVDYLMAHTVYDFRPNKSVKDTLNGQSVRRFDVHMNTGDFKVASQSYATVSGFGPTDIQDAMTAIDGYRGADMSLYIDSNNNIVRLTANKKGQQTTFDYSNFNKAAVAAEPQTKLTWQNFAAAQQQLSAQTAAKQPAAQLDILRKNQIARLQKAFKAYQIQTGSYPSLANGNDVAWVAANLPNVDPDSLRDPISASAAILATPKAGVIAYQVLNADGKPGCDNTAINACTQFKLTSTLSTTQQYSLTQP